MNILILTKKFPYPLKDGETIAIFNLAKHFAHQGNKVVLLSMVTSKHPYNEKNIPGNVKSLIDCKTVWVDTKIHWMRAMRNVFKKIPLHAERFYSAAFERSLINLLANNTFDIIQLEGLFLSSYIPIIKKYSIAKIIYRSHNVEGLIWFRVAQNIKNPLKKYYIGLQAKKLIAYEKNELKNIDAVIPISIADAQYYSRYLRLERICYIPAGVEKQENNIEDIPIDTNAIYFIGGLDWIPNSQGLKWFIQKIFPDVIKKFPDIKLHIAGRHAPAWLKNNKHPHIIFYGDVSDAIEFISNKFLCIVPLLAGSGMKLKIMEALAAKKPVVTTNIGAEGLPQELIQYLYIAANEAEFNQKIEWCIVNADTALSRAKIASRYIYENFDNKKLAINLLNYYARLI